MSWFTLDTDIQVTEHVQSIRIESMGQKNGYPVVSTWTLISMPEGSFVLA